MSVFAPHLPHVLYLERAIMYASSHWSFELRKRGIDLLSADSTLRELLVEPGVTDSGFHIILPSHSTPRMFVPVAGGGQEKLSTLTSQQSSENLATRFV